MKHLKLLALAFLISMGAHAQIDSWYIGGSAGFANDTYTQNTPGVPSSEMVYTNWDFSPEIGAWINDNIQVGLGLNITGGVTKQDGDKVNSSVLLSPTVYGRYYWKTSTPLSFFTGANVQIITGTMTTYNVGTDLKGKTTGFGANFNGGIAYAINDKLSILGELGVLGFSSVKNTPDKENENTYSKISQTGLFLNALGPVFNIGLNYTFL